MSKLFTLREVVGQAQIEVGIAQVMPQVVINSLDQDIAQMVALLQAVADEVLLEEPYKTTLGDGVWCAAADGTPRPLGPADNTDVILFNGRLAVAGLKYHFKAAKGLEFGEELRDFNSQMSKLAVPTARILDLDSETGRLI